ncbi:MAG: GNAT family N-acetyltransferase, partial [Bacilli bacterium]|nr:GNAT family N-acetyltransferase [Bacilli bacterium]
MENLRLIEPSIEHKEEGIDYINEHLKYNSEINGSGGLDRYLDNYEGWLIKLENDRNNPEPNRVHALTYYLVRESDNRIIGMINIRLELNEALRQCGGHIGYGIRPSERRKGYNKINLYLALEICKQYGLEEILLDCEKDNLGSRKTIEALGGILVSEYIDETYGLCQKYRINVPNSIKEYYNLY